MSLPIANCKRIIKSAGADRVSNDAGKQLSLFLDEIGSTISGRAVELAKHAGRKTVQIEDIQLAAESVI